MTVYTLTYEYFFIFFLLLRCDSTRWGKNLAMFYDGANIALRGLLLLNLLFEQSNSALSLNC